MEWSPLCGSWHQPELWAVVVTADGKLLRSFKDARYASPALPLGGTGSPIR